MNSTASGANAHRSNITAVITIIPNSPFINFIFISIN